MLVGIVWLALSARADVRVEDPSGCLDLGLLYEELEQRQALPSGAALWVAIAASAEHRSVSLEVSRQGEVVWSRRLDVLDGDCAALHAAVAITVHRGLSALPRHTWSPTRRVYTWVGAAAGGSLGLGPADPRARLDGRLAVGSRARITGHLRGEVGVWRAIGQGEARSDAGLLGVGLALAFPAGEMELRPEAKVLGGMSLSVGRDFEANAVQVTPRALGATALELGSGPWGIAVELEVPITRLVLVGDDGIHEAEAPARLGLAASWTWRRDAE